jgi:hypothetical protein
MLDFSRESFHPYITARDHERTWKRDHELLVKSEPLMEMAASDLRQLLEVPSSLKIHLLAEFPTSFNGLDVSWSSPQETIDWSKHTTVWANTSVGLGVPGRAIALISSVGDSYQTTVGKEILKSAYLVSRICQDFLRRGIAVIRREARYKDAVLRHTLNMHPVIGKDRVDPESAISLIRFTPALPGLSAFLRARGILVSEAGNRIEVCNFPAHSKEQFEALADSITAWRPED